MADGNGIEIYAAPRDPAGPVLLDLFGDLKIAGTTLDTTSQEKREKISVYFPARAPTPPER